MSNIPTPHMGAKKEQIAKTVLMPGDPLRAKFIAETFLENYECVNEIRNMLAFTGEYQGKKVTVCGGGMGMPSVGIYTYELFHFYDVEQIIRIGTAGAISDRVQLRDVVIGIGASTDSAYAKQYHLPGTYAPTADFELARAAALYMNAARAGKKALCMLTISDAPLKNQSLSAQERQTGFTDMMKIALEIA